MQFKNYNVRICFVKDGEMTDILSCLSMLPSSGITCNELMVKIPTAPSANTSSFNRALVKTNSFVTPPYSKSIEGQKHYTQQGMQLSVHIKEETTYCLCSNSKDSTEKKKSKII